eukprot:CAMPEP_0119124150 /NCGR_PEP_ID=MMETSP1310-20130426/3850_1 /TAXON_ID=464262 /ORGANISM="Genus nov. species nov., Strain RCC2339" /LENGTH=395 /DNA_ID=CAMNT_0007114047 /DNA_START=153 /DNA_END=1337 /DNA_ORIENTATION=-
MGLPQSNLFCLLSSSRWGTWPVRPQFSEHGAGGRRLGLKKSPPPPPSRRCRSSVFPRLALPEVFVVPRAGEAGHAPGAGVVPGAGRAPAAALLPGPQHGQLRAFLQDPRLLGVARRGAHVRGLGHLLLEARCEGVHHRRQLLRHRRREVGEGLLQGVGEVLPARPHAPGHLAAVRAAQPVLELPVGDRAVVRPHAHVRAVPEALRHPAPPGLRVVGLRQRVLAGVVPGRLMPPGPGVGPGVVAVALGLALVARDPQPLQHAPVAVQALGQAEAHLVRHAPRVLAELHPRDALRPIVRVVGRHISAHGVLRVGRGPVVFVAEEGQGVGVEAALVHAGIAAQAQLHVPVVGRVDHKLHLHLAALAQVGLRRHVGFVCELALAVLGDAAVSVRGPAVE